MDDPPLYPDSPSMDDTDLINPRLLRNTKIFLQQIGDLLGKKRVEIEGIPYRDSDRLFISHRRIAIPCSCPSSDILVSPD